MKSFGFLPELGGNLFHHVLGAHGLIFPNDGLHGDEIDHALEFVFLSDGDLNSDRLGVQPFADGIDGVLEIGAHLVDLVDETNARHGVFIGLAPNFFRLRLHTMDGIEQGDGAIEHAQRALHFGGEIHVAGRINDVDADVAPHAGGGGAGDGDAALLFLLHPIHGGGAFMHLTQTVQPAGIKQDALRGGGLAGVNMGHDADIAAAL